MSDTLLRAIARDAGIQICAASTTELVERAHEIHNTTPLATAALGRTLTATAIMGSQLKVRGRLRDRADQGQRPARRDRLRR